MKKGILFIILILSVAVYAEDFWQSADGPTGGRIDAIAVDAGNIFAIRSTRIFLSTDGGDSWSDINGPSNINCLAVSPSGNPYLGVSYRGVWWTLNNGATWSYNQITHDPHSGLGASIFAIGIDSQGHIYTPSFRSFDGGNSWQEIDPPSTVTAFAVGAQDRIFVGTYEGVYFSTDNGTSWTARNTGIENIHITTLTINSNGDLYAGSLEEGIFYSSDEGITWTSQNTGLGSQNINSLAIAPNGDIYAATQAQGIYRSTDQGLTWTSVNGNLPDLHVRTIAINDNSNLFIGTETGGIFKSTDNGSTWVAKNRNINVRNLNAALTVGGDDLLLGTGGSGIFHSPDGHSDWTSKNNGLDNLYVSDLATDSSEEIFAGTYSGVFRTSDAGENWLPANNGIEDEHVARIANDPAGRLYILTETQSFGALFYSDDNGDDWTPIPIGNNDVFLESIAVDAQGNLFLSGFNIFIEGLVFISSDGGTTWSDTVLTQFSNRSFLAINNNDRLYAVFNGDEFFFSDDVGITWNTISAAGLPANSTIERFAFDSGNHIYATTQSDGIFYSENSGNNWTAKNDGLPTSNGYYPGFNFLYVNPEDVVYAGTFSDGLFIGVDNPTAIDPIQNAPDQFSLEQNYPNPFNPTTTIGFTIAERGFVKLTVFDLLGKEITTLINEEKAAGNYTVEFDAGKLSSGIYFYQLEAGNFKQTRRMILMR
ncbi:MAG: YCF48-related protein [Calditrichota bacterium]|jgi:photosystem II stability/assembly factor-like uncharacterized protein